MKSLSWKLCLMAGISCMALFGNPAPARASEDVPAAPDERLERLEQRINTLADRQELALRRFEAALAPQPGAPSERQALLPAPASETTTPAVQAAGADHPLAARLFQAVHKLGDLMRLMILGCILCNVLLAIWIFMDIRKRGEGSGIFVVLALVAGVPAAIIYSLVRIGDRIPAGGK
jgi:hypothetical protein